MSAVPTQLGSKPSTAPTTTSAPIRLGFFNQVTRALYAAGARRGSGVAAEARIGRGRRAASVSSRMAHASATHGRCSPRQREPARGVSVGMSRSSPPPRAPLWRRTLRILGRTARAYFADNIPRLGAALAFYITIAVAPLLVLTIAVAGMLFQDLDARETVVSEIENLVGTGGAEVVDSIEPPQKKEGGVLATIVGGVTLLFGALGVFRQLQGALNAIWRVHPKPTHGFWNLIGSQLFSTATVLMTGFLLLVSLIVSAVLSWFGAQTLGRLNLPAALLEVVNLSLSFLLITFLFGLIFKLLPNASIRWRHVWLGAAVTALLFSIGKSALGLYLGRASATSAYGAASSIIALLLWCYYASQIVFLGAEFTRITSRSNGGRDFTPLDAPEERSLA